MSKFNAAFWKWFGDSKVVDSKRKPLVVYHGTDELWTEPRSRKERMAHFDKMTEGLTDSIVIMEREYVNRSAGAIWWTDDEGVAEGYRDSYEENSGIISAYLSIQNPLDLRSKKTGIKKIEKALSEIYGKKIEIDDTYGLQLGVARAIVWDNSKAVKWAIDNGYDGLIHDDTDVGGRHTHTSFVTFEPSQIKSADQNDGTWDADDLDIRSNPEIDETPDCLGGKCLIFARQIRDEIGGNLVDVVEPEDSPALYYPGLVYHVVVKSGNKYFDGTGEWTEDELLDFWKRRGKHFEKRTINFVLEPHNRKRAKDQRMKGA